MAEACWFCSGDQRQVHGVSGVARSCLHMRFDVWTWCSCMPSCALPPCSAETGWPPAMTHTKLASTSQARVRLVLTLQAHACVHCLEQPLTICVMVCIPPVVFCLSSQAKPPQSYQYQKDVSVPESF